MEPNLRTVAILGRPNVGKSTLFNRLVGRRQALVHDMPGITRDRIEGEAVFGDIAFKIVDTAGMSPGGAEGSLQARLTAGALAGLEEADIGLFVIDARLGVTPLDAELAEAMRRVRKPILLVANKTESRASLPGTGEAWALGLGEPIEVSAEHNLGIPDLLDALRPHLLPGPDDPAALVDEAPDEGPRDGPESDEDAPVTGPVALRLAVVGRPNVGKSSLINRLIASDRLLTGPEPGLTRDAVDVRLTWKDRAIDLVDTAGLRRRARIEAPVDKLAASSSVRAIRGSHVVLLVLDATVPLEHQDLTIASYAVEEGRGLLVAANKWDLVADPGERLRALIAQLEDRLAQVRGVPVLPLSARTGRQVDRLLPAVVAAYERWRTRIPTGRLNRWLAQALERHTPPLAQGRRVKIRYMSQTASRPPTFSLFANKPADALPDSYIRYLSTSLRETFDLAGVPLRFQVRHGENPYDSD